MGQQNSCKTLIGVHLTMQLLQLLHAMLPSYYSVWFGELSFTTRYVGIISEIIGTSWNQALCWNYHTSEKPATMARFYKHILLTDTKFTQLQCLCCMHNNYSSQCCYNLVSCLLYTSPSPRDATLSRMPSSA